MSGDPLYVGDIDLAIVLITLLKVVTLFLILTVAVMLMIWFERKLLADMQNRIGPNRAGPWGILQTLADGVKMIFKEDLIPSKAERRVFILAPFLAVVPAFLLFSIIPIGGNFNGDNNGVVEWFGHQTYLQLADPPIGILFALALSSIAVYGVMLAGWSSGSKYPLLGSVRASAQMVSYEAALGLSVAAVVLVSDSLSTHDIVVWQAGSGAGDIVPNWNLLVAGVVPFIVFVIAGTAELNRPPFDLVEAEQEIVGGYQTEYSSFRFALFYLAEFLNAITMSAIFVTLFLGGPSGPVWFGLDWLWPTVWFLVKLMVFLVMFISFRATLPRFRYDQLMNLGWKLLIPVALGWFLLLAAIRVADDQSWNSLVVIGVALAIFAVSSALLVGAVRSGKRAREMGEVFD
jgi:NADH-quinone oxidoreductase subunit H